MKGNCNKVLAKHKGGGTLIAWVFAIHEYGCPSTRYGKKHGPCNCGGDEMEARFLETAAGDPWGLVSRVNDVREKP